MSEQVEQADKFEQLMSRVKFDPDTVKQLAVESGQQEPDEDFRRSYKLKNGENVFRIVPFDDGQIIKIFWVHMNLGVPFLCPNKLDKTHKCPDCDFGWKLYNENGKKHTDDSRNFLAQEKWLVRGIFRAEEEADIKKYGYPKLRFLELSPTNGKIILSYFNKENIEEWGDISDFTNGRDLKIKKDEEKAKARQSSVAIERQPLVKPVFSKVKTGTKEFKEMFVNVFENAVDVDSRYESKTYEQILELMKKFKDKMKSSDGDDSFSHESDEFVKARNSVESESDFDEIMKRL